MIECSRNWLVNENTHESVDHVTYPVVEGTDRNQEEDLIVSDTIKARLDSKKRFSGQKQYFNNIQLTSPSDKIGEPNASSRNSYGNGMKIGGYNLTGEKKGGNGGYVNCHVELKSEVVKRTFDSARSKESHEHKGYYKGIDNMNMRSSVQDKINNRH